MLQVQRLTELPAQIPTAVGLEPLQDIVGFGFNPSIQETQSASMEEYLHGGRKEQMVLYHHCQKQARLT